jgi:excisionase family DNA binding protein
MEKAMTHPIPDHAHLLTVEQAGECLGIGRTKTYELVMNGNLASIKIGSRRLIAVSSVAGYIREQLSPGGASPLTRDFLEHLVESGELQSITVGDFVFVSVDSLDSYVRDHVEVAS